MKASKLLLIAALATAATMPNMASAAQILSQSRSLQAIVDAVDYSPLAGDEVSDFKNAAGFGAFNTSAGVTFPFNNNLASSVATQNTQIDAAAMRIYGSGSTTAHIDTRFDSTDVTSGAFVNTQAYSGVSAEFRLGNTGKVHVSVTLETTTSAMDSSGVPTAEARIQTATGVVVWRQLISATNRISFTGDVPLATGTYQFIITAGSNIVDSKIGSRLLDTSTMFTVDAAIIEDAGAPPRKKK